MSNLQGAAKRKYTQTYIVEFTVFVAALLCYRLALSRLGDTGFTEYALLRRSVSFILPLVILGLQVAATRFIAQIAVEKSTSETKPVFFTAYISVMGMSLILVTMLMVFRTHVSWAFFGSEDYAYLVAPLGLYLVGFASHAMTYSYYRGMLQMRKANLLQFINLGIGAFVFFFVFDTLPAIIYATGIFWLVVSLFSMSLILRKTRLQKSVVANNFKTLLAFGLQRVPGDFSLAALLALPSYLTAHYFTFTEAGYVAFGISVLNIAGAAVAPLSLILLPEARMMISKKEIKALKKITIKILKWGLLIAAGGLLLFLLFTDFFLTVYLGTYQESMTPIIRIIALSAPAYMMYVALRSLNDAFYKKAVNTVSLGAALVLFCILFFIFRDSFRLTLSGFVISMYLLFFMTLWFNSKIFNTTKNHLNENAINTQENS